MLTTIVLVAALAILAYIAYRVVLNYRAAEGTVWERLIVAAKNSATVLWQYVVIAGGTLLGWSVQLADALNMPEVRSVIQDNLKPEYVGLALVGIAIITVVARLRTLRPAALASEASGQRGNFDVPAPDTRPEPGSSARE